jgi:hypothetical protein
VQHSLFLWSSQIRVAQQHRECIVSLTLQQWLPEHTRMLRYTYITYVNFCRTVWKWLTGTTDRTGSDPLQETVLTHIICLQVNEH